MKPRLVRNIFWAALALGAVIGLIGAFTLEALALIGIFLMLAAMVFQALFYRCPHCGRYLGRFGGSFCPHCGKEF